MGKSTSTESTNNVWWIPFTYTWDFETVKLAWFGSTEQKLETPILNSSARNDQWIVANVEETGLDSYLLN